MKQFEDQFKDAFDGFEPEVDPSVWTNVSNAISSPAPVPTGSAVSGGGSAAGGFSAVAGWVAAAITVAAGVLIYHFVSPSESPVTKDVTPSTTLNSSVVESPAAVSNDDGAQKSNTIAQESAVQQPLNKSVVEHHAPAADMVAEESQKVINSESHANTISAQEPTKHEILVPVKNSEKAENSSSFTPNPLKNAENQAENAVIPVLIASSHCGFAPLAVTFMLNSNLKTDFNFGDGNVAFRTNSNTHKYENPGRYTITCEVNGKQLSTEVEVLGPLGTAFSPNGDGINDIFNFGGNDVEKVEVRVYNRFGKTVFTGTGSNPGWDGNYPDGTKAESGTYFYDIFATSVGGTDFKQKGTINLFR